MFGEILLTFLILPPLFFKQVMGRRECFLVYVRE